MGIEKIRSQLVPHDARLKEFDVVGDLTVTFSWNPETCRNEIVLHNELRYILFKYGVEIIARPKFKCDGGSVPRMFWSLISDPYATRYLLGFVLHDILYAAEYFPRSTCDWILLEILEELRVSWIRRNEVWSGVKIGGRAVWSKHTPDSVHDARQHTRMIIFKPTAALGF